MCVYLRKALENDVDILYRWANDPDVRKYSFSTSKISYEEHLKWYQMMLKDKWRQQYIYIYNNKAIGQARIIVNGEIGEIGYSIEKDERNKGHGKKMLNLLMKQIIIDYPCVKSLIAKIKSENIISQRIFLNIGYIEKYKVYELKVDRLEQS